MKLKAGRWRVDIEEPFFSFIESRKERVAKVTDWFARVGAKVEQFSPNPDRTIFIFTLPKPATWNFEFATPRASRAPTKAIPWDEAKKRGPRDSVDVAVDTTKKAVKTVKEAAPAFGALAVLLVLAALANRSRS